MIVVHTQNGVLPRYLAKYRPSVPILACCDNPMVIKQLMASRGIMGYHIPAEASETLIA